MSRNGNGPNTSNECQKQQGGYPLPFFDHDLKAYWELNVQMLATGTTQLNTANNVGTKIKAILIKLLVVHDKDNINLFAETKRRLEVENFPKGTRR
eukprot:11168947-Ditylum_brightwellii.AAC.1